MIRIAINGFGRIGRNLLRVLLADKEFEVVAINDLADLKTSIHLFKYDSVHGKFQGEVNESSNGMLINNHEVVYIQESDPSKLPWGKYDVDVVIEATGLFKSREKANMHLEAGAKQVVISAPPEGSDIKTVCVGINEEILDTNDKIVSNASCTTNSAAPLVKVMKELATIETGYITTVHSYTTDQKLHDVPHKDLRRARAAALSIVPTTTGAAKAITRIFPDLEGRLGGCGIRVPVPDGSLTDMTFIVKEELTEKEVNNAFKKAAEEELKGILEYTDEPLVSIDIVDNTNSCVFDSLLTSVIGNMVKIVGWYDNEIGYSNRIADLVKYMHSIK